MISILHKISQETEEEEMLLSFSYEASITPENQKKTLQEKNYWLKSFMGKNFKQNVANWNKKHARRITQ